MSIILCICLITYAQEGYRYKNGKDLFHSKISIHRCKQLDELSYRQKSFVVFHQEDFHEIIKVTVQDSLSIRSLMTGTQVLDHLVRMKDIASDLRSPFDLLLLPLKLCLLLLTLLQLYIIQTRFQDTEGILSVIKLRTFLSVFKDNTARDMSYSYSGLHLVDILSSCTA